MAKPAILRAFARYPALLPWRPLQPGRLKWTSKTLADLTCFSILATKVATHYRSLSFRLTPYSAASQWSSRSVHGWPRRTPEGLSTPKLGIRRTGMHSIALRIASRSASLGR